MKKKVEKLVERLIFVGTVLIVLAVCNMNIIESKSMDTADVSAVIRGPVTAWTVFQDNRFNFELKYPQSLIPLYEQRTGIMFRREVPYRHADPCDNQDQPATLEVIADFYVVFEVIHGTFRESLGGPDFKFIRKYLVGPNQFRLKPGFIDRYQAVKLNGYRISMGVEGCGEYLYFFAVAPRKTLLITRYWVPEFSPAYPDYQKCLAIPGIILPEDEARLFDKMMATVSFEM